MFARRTLIKSNFKVLRSSLKFYKIYGQNKIIKILDVNLVKRFVKSINWERKSK